jgi:aminoglycoside phosphotransferase (APT) family kinase protein
MDRRNPYQSFDPSLLQSFLHGRDILSAELLPAGKANTNYRLILSDGNKYVLRLYSQGNPALETYVMGLVEDLVPVPKEMERGDAWSVFSFIDGAHLEKFPERLDVAAEALARISSVRFESPGIVNPDGTVTPFSFGGIKGFILEKLGDPAVQEWIGPAAVEGVFGVLAEETNRLDELEAECRLVHGDFNPTNILIQDGRVSGILDWEHCHSGTPYMDIGNLLRHSDPARHDQIRQGLEAGGMRLPPDWKERAELVDLTSQLEFLTSTSSADFKRQCVARIHRFMRPYGYQT